MDYNVSIRFPHAVTVSRKEGVAMRHLRYEAVVWIEERIDPYEYCYTPCAVTAETHTTEFAFKDPDVALEFKMRWA